MTNELPKVTLQGKITHTEEVNKGVTNNKPWAINESTLLLSDNTTLKLAFFSSNPKLVQQTTELLNKYVEAECEIKEKTVGEKVFVDYKLKKLKELEAGTPIAPPPQPTTVPPAVPTPTPVAQNVAEMPTPQPTPVPVAQAPAPVPNVEQVIVPPPKPRQQSCEADLPRKDRAMSVAYAKDLVVAGKIDIKDLLDKAEEIWQYIRNGPAVDEMEPNTSGIVYDSEIVVQTKEEEQATLEKKE